VSDTTIRDAMRAATARLNAAGVPDAARDVRLLMAQAIGVSAAGLIARERGILPAPVADHVDEMVAARAQRQPIAQILGRREFFGRAFKVTPDTLDPRPETETLLEEALSQDFNRILDLGTGTGCIAVTLLAERKGATGVATDVSQDALDVAQANAKACNVDTRLRFVRSDWFASVPPLEAPFDLIISNPPYIAESEMADLAPDVREWEPRLALTDGADGLSAYKTILEGFGPYLAPEGRLMVEIGFAQGDAVADLFLSQGLEAVEVGTDLGGRARIVTGQMPKRASIRR